MPYSKYEDINNFPKKDVIDINKGIDKIHMDNNILNDINKPTSSLNKTRENRNEDLKKKEKKIDINDNYNKIKDNNSNKIESHDKKGNLTRYVYLIKIKFF